MYYNNQPHVDMAYVCQGTTGKILLQGINKIRTAIILVLVYYTVENLYGASFYVHCILYSRFVSKKSMKFELIGNLREP